MTSDELKTFCKERGLTYAQLAEKIGMTEPSLRSAISTNKITLQVQKSVEMLTEIEGLKSELKDWQAVKEIFKRNL